MHPNPLRKRSSHELRRLEVEPATEPKTATTTAATDDWRWQLRHALSTTAELAEHIALTPEERQGALTAERAGLPIRVTPYYLSLVDPRDPSCPIRRQVIPTSQESEVSAGDLRDPLGEEAHEAAAHLIQRYPDRALMV